MPGIKHPARHYVNYLISRRIYDTATLARSMLFMGLPVGDTQEQIEELVKALKPLRREMVFPSVFNPRDKKPSEATQRFLHKWSIVSAWTGDDHFGAAVDILSDAQLRHSLQLMLLSPLTAITIARRLQRRFDMPDSAMNAGVVRTFGHYFWDPGALSTAEWSTFLAAHYPKESFEYLCALQAPRSTAGAAFALALADKDSNLLAPAERYALVSATGFRRFMEHAFSGDASVSQTYAALAALNIMRTGDEELDKYRGGSVELINELKRMETVYDSTKPMSLQDMAFVRPILTTTAEPVEEKTDGT